MEAFDRTWDQLTSSERRARLIEISKVFLTLGTIAFGGPAAHIAMMSKEIVEKRKWISRQRFLDLLGSVNLIPGPNSTELAIHLGFHRGRWAGLVLAGSCFILPAMLIVLILAFLYVKYEHMPQLSWLLYGIKPVILAIVLQALWNLGLSAIRTKTSIAIVLAVIILTMAGFHELVLLVLAGSISMIIGNWQKVKNNTHTLSAPLLAFSLGSAIEPKIAGATSQLFWIFLKIGSILYGSGYVLLAFLQKDFVDRLGVLSSQQLLDAVAIGQFTPGPVFTTATFIGYLISGVPGALMGTLGIFLPSFVFVAVLTFWMDKLRTNPWVASFIDGVTVASLALMAMVSLKLGVAAVIDIPTAILLICGLVTVFRFKLNSAWLVLAGGLIGLGRYLWITL
ncbi:chromate efflux transporter [Brevibacillus sp. SYSU BS000544]|uniref:chromate efflux transporter n=1 Tax=Brevibacillus sp. SYSU BS000544 TaxID=3416443 RepID=UPI003CE4DA85